MHQRGFIDRRISTGCLQPFNAQLAADSLDWLYLVHPRREDGEFQFRGARPPSRRTTTVWLLQVWLILAHETDMQVSGAFVRSARGE